SIMEEGSKDRLEAKLADLITILKNLSGLEIGDLGVTGSLLTKSHNPEFSDIDLTVYGSEASQSLKETILEMRGDEGIIQPFNAAKKEVWSRDRSKRFPLNIKELMGFADRRWNYGLFMDTYFSIHPVRTDGEITEGYGDKTYIQLGMVTGKGMISDSRESIYLPSVYKLEKAEIKGGHMIDELVSYEGLFCDMFYEGEMVEFGGVLERVTGKSELNRVVIGGAGSVPSFIKLSR
ncbi:MAG: nucleotidyltransferase domain-containing protein, partial [Candidatus Bathyarchaeota archaeon]